MVSGQSRCFAGDTRWNCTGDCDESDYVLSRNGMCRACWARWRCFLRKVTVPSLLEKKLPRRPIAAVTAYDYASARLVDEAGLDVVLVGDSLAMVMQGHENTLAVTMDEMLVYTRGRSAGGAARSAGGRYAVWELPGG